MGSEATVRIENRQRVLMIATLALAALLAADKLVYEPLAGVWQVRAARVAELRQNLADGALLVQRERSLRARWDRIQTNALPRNTSLAEQQVLKAFDAWSQDSHATITAMTPQWKHAADDYQTIECHVDASGALAALTRLLYDIEKSPMALQLESVDIRSRDDAGQDLTMGLVVSGLVLTPDGQQP